MAHITTHYEITDPVPFLDIDVAVDNRMFLDPHAIRLQRAPDPFVSEANHATETFFDEVTRCALSSSPDDQRHGLDLLQHFEEPWETRLGLAKKGFEGHGGAEEIGSWIWEALTTDLEALLRIGILRQLEDLPLFVGGVDRDITSDVTTRIVFEALVEFTAQTITDFPQFRSAGHRVGVFERQVWDVSKLEWTSREVELPVVDGKPLLLVPRDWARPTLLMSAGRFYETSVLSYAQLEQAVMSSEGKLLKTPKDVLKTQSVLARGRGTNLRVTRRANEHNDDLIAYFRTFVDSRYEPLGDDEIIRRIA
jgi:hypothetical protein